MNKNLKIVVYAISKNEEKFVDRWVNSMKEADDIVVLDTGSTDGTIEKLKSLGVKVVKRIISPWRFDVARNESLKLVPPDTDVCVCTDLDEIFESGWRKKIEENWQENTKQLRYKYVWNVLENNQDGVTFMYEKIHALNGFKWIYPVHEILSCDNLLPHEISTCVSLVLRHFPDPNKSRSQYLKLLELSVKECPESDRNTHYLAREYMFNKRYIEAISTFKQHLSLKNATWKEERGASLRYIGDCYFNLNKSYWAKFYYKKAIVESPKSRESYLSLAELYYLKKDYLSTIFVLKNMLEIKEKSLSYMTNPHCWNAHPFDLLAFCYYKINDLQLAIFYTHQALLMSQDNNRLQENLKYYLSLLNKN